jgi:anthranilate synthase/aminodeoxychorismate synthase-like glutamine amidotransferase
MRILLLDCDDSFTLNIYDYLKQCDLDVDVVNHKVYQLNIAEGYSAIVLSPGPNSPSDLPILFEILKLYGNKKPILGVCLGHQAIGMYYGHSLIKSKQPLHGISVKISAIDHPIFDNIDTEKMMVMRYNSLVVDETENSELEVIAKDEVGEIMAFKHKSLPIYSFQFHPESVGTPEGLTLLKNWTKLITN